MHYRIILGVPICLVLAGCGGGGTSGGVMVEDVATDGGGTLNFSNFLDLDSTQLAGIDASDAGTFSEFAKANSLPVGVFGDPSASFNGSMTVQMGGMERYYTGDVDLTINFTNGTGRGTVGFGSISGDDVQNHETDISLIDINVTEVSGSTFEGTITGDVDVSFEVNQDLLDTYTFDTTFDSRFVDDGVGGGFLGLVSGIVTSSKRGEETVDGIMVAGRDLFR